MMCFVVCLLSDTSCSVVKAPQMPLCRASHDWQSAGTSELWISNRDLMRCSKWVYPSRLGCEPAYINGGTLHTFACSCYCFSLKTYLSREAISSGCEWLFCLKGGVSLFWLLDFWIFHDFIHNGCEARSKTFLPPKSSSETTTQYQWRLLFFANFKLISRKLGALSPTD